MTRCGVERLASEVGVAILDASPLVRSTTRPRSSPLLPPGAAAYHIRSTDDFRRLVRELGIQLVIDHLPPRLQRNSLRLAARRMGTVIVKHAAGPVPPPPRSGLLTKLVERTPRSFQQVHHLGRVAGGRISQKNEAPVDYFISAGDATRLSRDARTADKVISGQSLDCDEFSIRRVLSDLPEEFDTFIDSGGPIHPDFKDLGVRPSASEATYFAELQRFLLTARELTGRQVVIARHPRMLSVSYHDRLPEFRIVDSASAELVRRSHSVMDSGSMATSFSVLAKKNVSFITPGAKPGSADWRPAAAFAAALGRRVYTSHLDFRNSLLLEPPIPHTTFEDYRRLYLYSDDSTRRTFPNEVLSILRG